MKGRTYAEKRRVLIVDDNADDVEMLHRFLTQEGTAVRGVIDSAQAERAFKEFEPDIVLLDLHMPEPDGLALLQRLRSSRAMIGFLPVIVLTGDVTKTARDFALLFGADDFLTKPLDGAEVQLRVRNLLRTRQLYLELAQAKRALQRRLPKGG
jgi:putative two-component system response regulator